MYVHILYVHTQSSKKKNYFVACIKKKIYVLISNNHIEASKIVFFTQATTNVLFCQNLILEHKMSRCKCKI
jgi:hypothetical protein